MGEVGGRGEGCGVMCIGEKCTLQELFAWGDVRCAAHGRDVRHMGDRAGVRHMSEVRDIWVTG